MNYRYILFGLFCVQSLGLMSCGTDNSEPQADGWSLSEPHIISPDGEPVAPFTQMGHTDLVITPEHRLKFNEGHYGTTIHTRSRCVVTDSNEGSVEIEGRSSRPLFYETMILTFLPKDVFLPRHNLRESTLVCSFNFKVMNDLGSSHAFEIESHRIDTSNLVTELSPYHQTNTADSPPLFPDIENPLLVKSVELLCDTGSVVIESIPAGRPVEGFLLRQIFHPSINPWLRGTQLCRFMHYERNGLVKISPVFRLNNFFSEVQMAFDPMKPALFPVDRPTRQNRDYQSVWIGEIELSNPMSEAIEMRWPAPDDPASALPMDTFVSIFGNNHNFVNQDHQVGYITLHSDSEFDEPDDQGRLRVQLNPYGQRRIRVMAHIPFNCTAQNAINPSGSVIRYSMPQGLPVDYIGEDSILNQEVIMHSTSVPNTLSGWLVADTYEGPNPIDTPPSEQTRRLRCLTRGN